MFGLQTMNRVAFGKPLAAQGTIQADVAQSRIEIEQTRLMVLKAAHMMDNYGNKVGKGQEKWKQGWSRSEGRSWTELKETVKVKVRK